jgi:DNA-binding beta-propeller fold protein YncE
MRDLRSFLAVSVVAAALVAATPRLGAQLAVSSNDAKITLVNGVQTVVRDAPPDTLTLLDLGGATPKIVAELQVPNSVIGPPQSVAIAPDGSIALVTASTKIDPKDPTKTVPDNRVTVIDLKAPVPAVLTTLQAGNGASGVSINPAGTLALVANRFDGNVSVFTIAGKTVTPAGRVELGAPESVPGHVVFTPDGARAFVTRNADSLISMLSVSGARVEYTKRDIAAGLKPYGIEIAPAGDVALVANIGAGGSGGVDTVSVIDLRLDPPRAVDQVAVGILPEGIAISPDGEFVALTVMNGTNQAATSPFFHDFGRLRIYRLRAHALTPVTEARIGHWCQGAAWSGDGRTVLVQCMVEQEMRSFHFDGRVLTPGTTLKVKGGPAGIRVAPVKR